VRTRERGGIFGRKKSPANRRHKMWLTLHHLPTAEASYDAGGLTTDQWWAERKKKLDEIAQEYHGRQKRALWRKGNAKNSAMEQGISPPKDIPLIGGSPSKDKGDSKTNRCLKRKGAGEASRRHCKKHTLFYRRKNLRRGASALRKGGGWYFRKKQPDQKGEKTSTREKPYQSFTKGRLSAEALQTITMKKEEGGTVHGAVESGERREKNKLTEGKRGSPRSASHPRQ